MFSGSQSLRRGWRGGAARPQVQRLLELGPVSASECRALYDHRALLSNPAPYAILPCGRDACLYDLPPNHDFEPEPEPMSVEALLDIQELRASIEDREILRGISLRVRHGEVHAIMGPNGSGKSTLSKVLAGHPSYTVTAGSVQFEGRELLEKEPDERSREGVFLAFQYPSEIPGVSIQNFLRTALNARREKDIPVLEFRKLLYSKMDMLGMDHSFATRFVNATRSFRWLCSSRSSRFSMKLIPASISMHFESSLVV
jgi:hypothetical protein